MSKNKSYCVKSGNKATLFTMLCGRGMNSVHLPESNPLWLHHYPPYSNPTSSHNEDNETYLKGLLKALFGYCIKGVKKELPAISLSSTTIIPTPFIWLNLT